ncbi:hypothetical protein QOT17_024008 [Balamuthia mandrillaris]
MASCDDATNNGRRENTASERLFQDLHNVVTRQSRDVAKLVQAMANMSRAMSQLSQDSANMAMELRGLRNQTQAQEVVLGRVCEQSQPFEDRICRLLRKGLFYSSPKKVYWSEGLTSVKENIWAQVPKTHQTPENKSRLTRCMESYVKQRRTHMRSELKQQIAKGKASTQLLT